ncbi:SIMPL domain-containing protein [Candidatus Parcubacteria bacterium]|nr:SIMPL domain-containing protein [Candidatus Parcubacteria bacterium]
MNDNNFQKIEKHKGLLPVLLLVLVLLLTALFFSTVVDIQNKIKQGKYIGQEIETKNTITVFDKGEVYAKPDLALSVFSVVTEAKTVNEAMAENTEKMNAIINFMKSEGVEEKDLKTISFNIYPRYEWHRAEIPPYPEGRRVLVGYEVRQSLQVKIRDMAKIGDIIQGATETGANQVGDLQFTIDNQDELKKQAREQAIEKAKTKAKELASQLDVNLVRITSFQETSVFPRYYGLEKMVGIGAGEEAPAPQIETGENKIEVTVTITYEIN